MRRWVMGLMVIWWLVPLIFMGAFLSQTDHGYMPGPLLPGQERPEY